jgi:hypothetical protein
VAVAERVGPSLHRPVGALVAEQHRAFIDDAGRIPADQFDLADADGFCALGAIA